MKTIILSPKKYINMNKLNNISIFLFVLIFCIGFQCKKMETPSTQDEKETQEIQTNLKSFVPKVDKIDDNYFEGNIDGKFFRTSAKNDSIYKFSTKYFSYNGYSKGNSKDTSDFIKLNLGNNLLNYSSDITLGIPVGILKNTEQLVKQGNILLKGKSFNLSTKKNDENGASMSFGFENKYTSFFLCDSDIIDNAQDANSYLKLDDVVRNETATAVTYD
jgi:hypothetical protein